MSNSFRCLTEIGLPRAKKNVQRSAIGKRSTMLRSMDEMDPNEVFMNILKRELDDETNVSGRNIVLCSFRLLISQS